MREAKGWFVRHDARNEIWYAVRDRFVTKYGWEVWKKHQRAFNVIALKLIMSEGNRRFRLDKNSL